MSYECTNYYIIRDILVHNLSREVISTYLYARRVLFRYISIVSLSFVFASGKLYFVCTEKFNEVRRAAIGKFHSFTRSSLAFISDANIFAQQVQESECFSRQILDDCQIKILKTRISINFFGKFQNYYFQNY